MNLHSPMNSALLSQGASSSVDARSLAALRTTVSIKPCCAQSLSKPGDLAGMAMYSLIWRTMSPSHWALTWSSAMPAFKTEDGKRAVIKSS